MKRLKKGKSILVLFLLVLFLMVTSSCSQDTTEGYKEINGVSHYYKTIGAGEPIVILHGGPGMFHDYLVSYLAPLADDYQLIF